MNRPQVRAVLRGFKAGRTRADILTAGHGTSSLIGKYVLVRALDGDTPRGISGRVAAPTGKGARRGASPQGKRDLLRH